MQSSFGLRIESIEIAKCLYAGQKDLQRLEFGNKWSTDASSSVPPRRPSNIVSILWWISASSSSSPTSSSSSSHSPSWDEFSRIIRRSKYF